MKELQQAIESIHERINNAVLSSDFEVIERGEHFVKIKYAEYTCYVWMANAPESTGIYKLETPMGDIQFKGVGIAFKKPATCRKIVNTPKSEEERKALAERKKQLEAELAKINEMGE